ncbi:MAG: hypothetical protein SFY81_03060 [Verrucomicrobiota bacterium]|nr:hypothetical protein [Verrucomicrobiota bacterium]
MVLITGAPGADGYDKTFRELGEAWEKLASSNQFNFTWLGHGSTNTTNDLHLFESLLASEPREGNHEFWLILIGHGTFNGREAKFNLRGPDLEAKHFVTLLNGFKRPTILINAFSASGAFLKPLSRQGRVIVTATRAGSQINYSRFGEQFTEMIGSSESDLDKDGQTSLLEAFISSARRVADFYKSNGRLATEHALLDDNGDGLGTPVDFFQGVRPTKKPSGNELPDGLRAHQLHLLPSLEEQQLTPDQRVRRNELELQIAALREQKSKFQQEEYFLQLEKLLLDLARLYQTNSSAVK